MRLPHMMQCKPKTRGTFVPHHPIHKHLRTDSQDDIGADCTPGTASSCQLFSMLEAMVVGSRGKGIVPVEIDADGDGVDTDHDVEIEDAEPLGEGSPIDDKDEIESDEHEVRPSEDSMAAPQRPPLTTRDTQHGRWLQQEHEDASAKLAALSMNTLSSPFGDGGVSRLGAMRRPSYRPEHLYIDDSEDDTLSESTAPTSEQPSTPTTSRDLPTIEQELGRFTRDEFNEDEKLQTIIDEFGDVADTMVNADGTSDPEHILAESQGTLFKGVMMIGNLHLTTHRLLFHALLPPDSAFLPPSGMPDQTDDGSSAQRPNIIRAGPVTVHRSSMYKVKRRVWMELSPEMITTYPSGDEKSRVRPLFSILCE